MRIASIVFATAATVAGCGSSPPPSFAFTGNSAAPAAEGSVTVTSGPNGNSKLKVVVRHLAPPERLAPGATAYVVWVAQVPDGAPQNVGALRLDSDLTGTLETTTPLREFVLTIGTETDPTAQAPTTTPVITRTVDDKK